MIQREFNPSRGPLLKFKPFEIPKSPEIKSESIITFSMPSAPQKRPCANGKSLEIHNVVVFFSSDAALLNVLTDAAKVPVSTLGEILKIIRDYKNHSVFF